MVEQRDSIYLMGEFKTIYAANVNIDKDGVITIKDAADRIYKDSLHEIFLTRALASVNSSIRTYKILLNITLESH